MIGEIDLSQFDDDFDEAEVEDRFSEVPDGNYQVQVERAELTTAKSSGNPMIKWMLRIISGSQAKKRCIFKNSVITPNTIKFVKADLLCCGLKLSKFSELEGRMGELLDVTLEITKRTKGDNVNVYYNKRITVQAGATIDQLDDDEVPF